MKARGPKIASYEDLCSVPASRVGEIIDGTLFTRARPESLHISAAARLFELLSDVFGVEHAPVANVTAGSLAVGSDSPGEWALLREPVLRLHSDVLIPDTAGWHRARLLAAREGASLQLSPTVSIAPDWVCEVLSPETETLVRTDKMPIYAREAVRNLWLVDPLTRTLEAYRLTEKDWQSIGTWRADAVACVEPFSTMALNLSAVLAL
jgi:Uma2 family endonuclease